MYASRDADRLYGRLAVAASALLLATAPAWATVDIAWDLSDHALILSLCVLAVLIAMQLWSGRVNRLQAELLQQKNALLTELAESESRFRALADTSVMGIFLFSGDRFLAVNPGMSMITGYSSEMLLDMRDLEFLHPDDRTLAHTRASARLRGEYVPNRYELRVLTADARTRWVVVAAGLTSLRGQPCNIGSMIDVTDQHAAHEALRESEMRLRLLTEHSRDVIWTMSLDGQLTYVSPAVERLRGYTPEESYRQPLSQMLTPPSLAQAQLLLDNARATAETGQQVTDYCGEFEQTTRSGGTVWVEMSVSGMYEQGRCVGLVGVTRDISERRRAEAQIHHLAEYDLLTDLPNRVLLADRLQQALAMARRNSVHLALMVLDLDRFKWVNDHYGHAAGDAVLKEAARRMQACLRASDTVARVGGDEFVVLLPSVSGAADALNVGEQIRAALAAPYRLGELQCHLSASVGVAVYPEDGADALLLQRNADAAMYAAKQAGANRVRTWQAQRGESTLAGGQ